MMVFELMRKFQTKVPFCDKIVVLRSSIRFPIKLRKKEHGMYTHVNIYKDDNKLGFEFTDDPLTGYAVIKDRIPIIKRIHFKELKQGIYDYIKQGNLYVIDVNSKIQEKEE